MGELSKEIGNCQTMLKTLKLVTVDFTVALQFAMCDFFSPSSQTTIARKIELDFDCIVGWKDYL